MSENVIPPPGPQTRPNYATACVPSKMTTLPLTHFFRGHQIFEVRHDLYFAYQIGHIGGTQRLIDNCKNIKKKKQAKSYADS